VEILLDSLSREIPGAFRTLEHGARHEDHGLTPRTFVRMKYRIFRLYHVLAAWKQPALQAFFRFAA
jgi:hypothetical protein